MEKLRTYAIIDTVGGSYGSKAVEIDPNDINMAKRQDGLTYITLRNKNKIRTSEALVSILSKIVDKSNFEETWLSIMDARGGYSSIPTILNTNNIFSRNKMQDHRIRVVFNNKTSIILAV